MPDQFPSSPQNPEPVPQTTDGLQALGAPAPAPSPVQVPEPIPGPAQQALSPIPLVAPIPPAQPKIPFWKKWWFWASTGGGLVIILVGIFVAFMMLRSDPFEAVVMQLEAPQATTAGSTITYTVKYNNGSDLAMRNASVAFTYPTGFTPTIGVPDAANEQYTEFQIGDIVPGAEGEITVTGRLTGAVNSVHVTTATLLFSSDDSSATFSKEADVQVLINPSSITVSAEIPETHFSGEDIDYKIEIVNNESSPLSNVRVNINYPIGFTLEEATPQQSEDNVWTFDTLGIGARESIELKGGLIGDPDDAKRITIEVGRVVNGEFLIETVYEAVTRIVQPTVAISSTVLVNERSDDTTVGEGDRLEYTIQFRNTGVAALTGLVLEAKLDTRVLDLSTLVASNSGALVDSDTVRWDASVLPELANLAPNATGEVSFRLDIYKDIFITNASDQNMQVTVEPSVTVRGRKVEGEILVLKVGADPRLLISGAVIDGPATPKVGQKTTYEISWPLSVLFAGMENIRINSTVPPGVTWESVVTVSSGEAPGFNQATRTINWNVGKALANLGELSSPLTAKFRISVTPTVADVGKVLTLINKTTLVGQDSFALVPINIEFSELTSELGQAYGGEVEN
ncbi:hypothetical protein ACFL1U_02790 [Patescibacteria group bacterium]